MTHENLNKQTKERLAVAVLALRWLWNLWLDCCGLLEWLGTRRWPRPHGRAQARCPTKRVPSGFRRKKADSDSTTLVAARHWPADGPKDGGGSGTSRSLPKTDASDRQFWAGHHLSPGSRCRRRDQATHARRSALLPRSDPPQGGRLPGTQPGGRSDPDARAPGRTSTSPGPKRPTVRPRSGTTLAQLRTLGLGLRVDLTTTRHGSGDHGAHGTSRHLLPAATRLGVGSLRAHAHRM